MGRTYKPKPKLYTGKPIYKTVKKYYMSMLRKRVMESNGLFTRKKQVNFRHHFNLKDIRKWTEYYNINCNI